MRNVKNTKLQALKDRLDDTLGAVDWADYLQRTSDDARGAERLLRARQVADDITMAILELGGEK